MKPMCCNIGYKPGNVTHLDQATVHLSNQRVYIRCSLLEEKRIMNIYYQLKMENLILALQVKRWFAHWTYASLNKLKDKPVSSRLGCLKYNYLRLEGLCYKKYQTPVF